MLGITDIHLKNYRSFIDAKCRLSPVTLVIGANNAGKSNFLRGIQDAAGPQRFEAVNLGNLLHKNAKHKGARIIFNLHSPLARITSPDGKFWSEAAWSVRQSEAGDPEVYSAGGGGSFPGSLRLFILDHHKIGVDEPVVNHPQVEADGSGTTQVLQGLKSHSEKAFKSLVNEFCIFVPEVRNLILRLDPGKNCHLLVNQSGLDDYTPLSELSAGSRTILALLAIVHQAKRPQIILLEDIEHAIHPRGIAEMIETIRRISAEHGVQFIFTSHHPYVLDCFRAKEFWGDVVIVEKKDGVSRLANMDDRLKRLHYEEEMDQVRLSELWYSGLMGGVADGPPVWDKEP